MKKNRLFIGIGIVLILIIIAFRYFLPSYKIEDRTKKIDQFKSVEKEKAMSWLRVEGTNIDLPVMYYDLVDDVSDPTYDIAWSYTNDKKLPKKSTIFSHNVLNVSKKPLIGNQNHKRFEQLMAYIYYDFAKENQYIQYTIHNQNYLFKIYGVSFVKTDDIFYEDSNWTKDEMKEYIKKTKENSYFKYDVPVSDKDQLISLVTCTRFFGTDTNYSFVVDARLLRENERVKKSRVEEKENYKKIKEIMEGVKEDE